MGGSVYGRTSREPPGAGTESTLVFGEKASSCVIGGKVTGGFWNFPFKNGDTNTFFSAIFNSC